MLVPGRGVGCRDASRRRVFGIRGPFYGHFRLGLCGLFSEMRETEVRLETEGEAQAVPSFLCLHLYLTFMGPTL